jgi:hypothetical protein
MPAGVSAYTALANVTLGSTASTVTFSSIGQGFRDLVLVAMIYTTGGGASVSFTFNSDTTSANYPRVFMFGTGSTTGSGSISDRNAGAGETTGVQHTLNIMDYSATDKHKTTLIRYDNAAGITLAQALRWANTSAITSLQLGTSSTFAAGTSLALYGVSA